MKFLDRILGKVPATLPPLDAPCYNCKESGKEWSLRDTTKPTGKCGVCGGSGRQFTQAGVDLFNFISNHRGWIQDTLNKP